MTKVPPIKMPADAWDELNFPRPEENDFDRVVERAISRRGYARPQNQKRKVCN